MLGQADAESVEIIVRGVRGVMRELGMTAEGPAALADATYLDPAAVVPSPATGILYPLVERDQNVEQGAALARITDWFGTELAVVKAPIAGVVLYVVATPPITAGQPVACVGTPRKLEKCGQPTP
jgi:predicted deacylase